MTALSSHGLCFLASGPCFSTLSTWQSIQQTQPLTLSLAVTQRWEAEKGFLNLGRRAGERWRSCPCAAFLLASFLQSRVSPGQRQSPEAPFAHTVWPDSHGGGGGIVTLLLKWGRGKGGVSIPPEGRSGTQAQDWLTQTLGQGGCCVAFVQSWGLLSRILGGLHLLRLNFHVVHPRDWLRKLVQEVCKMTASSP